MVISSLTPLTWWAPGHEDAADAAGSVQTLQTRWAYSWCIQWKILSPQQKSVPTMNTKRLLKLHLLLKYIFCVCARTDILNVIKAQGSSFPSVLQRLSGKSFIMSMKETDSKERLCFYFLMKNFKIYKWHNFKHYFNWKVAAVSTFDFWGMLTYLNWQKMSAYSGWIPLACSTVTRKVKMLPTSSWPARPSRLSLMSATLPSLRSKKSQRRCYEELWCDVLKVTCDYAFYNLYKNL